MDPDKPVAIVTGASRGVGAAICAALAEAGARVACTARSTDFRPSDRVTGTLDEVVRRINERGGEAIALPADLTDEDAIVAMVKSTTDRLGRVDMLVNNAGVTLAGGVNISRSRYDIVMDVNVRAPLIATREVVPIMRDQGAGRIVNVSSSGALNVFPGTMVYGMAKVALERMTVDVAMQLREHNIALNCLRIDVPVASEGFIANVPDTTYDDWEPPETPAEGVQWILNQPISMTGQLLSLTRLRDELGIMASRTRVPFIPYPGQVNSWNVGTPDLSVLSLEG
jgi:citronellol/citronellal dehydrogenase